MSSEFADRRKEPRQPARGEVRLHAEQSIQPLIRGELVDIAPSGFRARHGCQALATGQVVRFQHPTAQGKARVMWTRIVGEAVESGFLVLGDKSPGPTHF